LSESWIKIEHRGITLPICIFSLFVSLISLVHAAPTVAPAAAPLAPEVRAKDAFKTGVDAFQQKQFDAAVQALTQVPELGDYLSLYKHWYLGQAYLELAKYKEAEPEFAKILQGQVSTELKYQAQFDLGEVAIRQKKYSEAVLRLQPLERKWRHSYRYPEVLYRLLIADLKLGHTASTCKRARKLYAKFPAHPTVIEWGSDLRLAKVEDKTLPCTASNDDFADRVRSLQWAGESDKAHKELTALLSAAHAEDHLRLDMLMASFLVNEGSVDDALNTLIRYYPQQKSNVAFLALLGRAAARSGEYQTAVGAFERVYNLSPKSKKGREALFQAAYLSYQFQDYDGAVRKFQAFIKANPRSGLTKDAQWHLAWLQYLRNDYRGALEKFAQVQKTSHPRRGKSDSLQERLLYWSAMAHIRLNEFSEARSQFETLMSKNPNSYYGIASEARLATIRARVGDGKRGHLAVSQQIAPFEGPSGNQPEEVESEEDIVDQPEQDTAATVAEENEEGDEEKVTVTDIKDPALKARIDVAQNLIQLGLNDLARWELIEVEKRTRNPQYLRMLINSYEGISSFQRSATIAELNFTKERDNGGLEGAKSLWNSMFPQAYKADVLQASQRYSVPQEWIWAIMRTESMYRMDVISPVGAKGLMQLMPFTARNLYKVGGEAVPDGFDLLNPQINVHLGGQYLARLMQKFSGQLALVAASYNAGPHRVEGWLMSFGHLDCDEFVEHVPFLETRNYIKKVIRTFTLYRRLYAKDQKPEEFLVKPLGVPIPTRAATRESWDSM
jgi:soluble lytic murein transglycosylase